MTESLQSYFAAATPEHSQQVFDAFCAHLLQDKRDELGAISKDTTKTHLGQIVEYLEVNLSELFQIFALMRRGFEGCSTIIDVVEHFYSATYITLSLERDIFPSQDFWSHVTARPFSEFYSGVLGFLGSVHWRARVSEADTLKAKNFLVKKIPQPKAFFSHVSDDLDIGQLFAMEDYFKHLVALKRRRMSSMTSYSSDDSWYSHNDSQDKDTEFEVFESLPPPKKAGAREDVQYVANPSISTKGMCTSGDSQSREGVVP